ncbi:MAG: peptide ABC transporter substrate-binding protein [Rhodospirillaceae bacterium]|nr:peptide ABC transporter substrate-binding protein [Rhodospirillaceae bacterium]
MPNDVIIAQSRIELRDAHDCTDSADTLAIFEALFDALVRRGPDGRFQPALAESWTLSPDARTWTFRLRPGLTFHDGSILDAAAIRFSIERMMRPEIGATLGAPAVWGQYLTGAKVETPDTRTVTVTTVEPTADLLDVLVSGYALPPHAADQPGFTEHPIGSGAYAIEATTPGEEIRMTANPNWWGGSVANPSLIWRYVAGSTDRAAALLDGGVQIATRIDPSDAEALGLASGTTRVDHIDTTAIIYLLNSASGPFSDPRVRRAVNLAVDGSALVETVLGGAAQPLSGFVSPSHIGSGSDTSGTNHDPDAARALLAEAGFGDGLTLGVDCPTRLPDEAEALTHAVAEQLGAVGITFEVHKVEDRTRYAERVRDKQIHDMCVFDSSPMSTFRVLNEKIDSRNQGSWWQGYRNVEVERLLDRSRITVEDAEREQLHNQCFALLCEDPPWLYLYNHTRVLGLAGEHAGFSMRADGILDVTALPTF